MLKLAASKSKVKSLCNLFDLATLKKQAPKPGNPSGALIASLTKREVAFLHMKKERFQLKTFFSDHDRRSINGITVVSKSADTEIREEST